MTMMSGSPAAGGVARAAVAAMPSPLSLSLPLQGGGDPRTVASPGGTSASLRGRLDATTAELRAAALVFGADFATSSPPPSRGRDREGGQEPFHLSRPMSKRSIAR